MSTSKRGSYHHGDLRSALLDEAMTMLEGGEAFSMRAVARRAQVSQTAPYRHFADREALEAALAAQGFRDLQQRLYGDGRPVDIKDEIAGFVLAYIEFALERPLLFRLMFGRGCHGDNDERGQAAHELLELLISSLSSAYPDADCEALGTTLWALAHGLASLSQDGMVEGRAQPGRSAVEMLVQSSLASIGLESGQPG